VASATELPFPDDAFDAGWTMSTLMHLPGDDAETALAELVRVIRAGGLLEVGVLGAATTGVHHDEHGRLFNHRDDDTWRHLLGSYGHLEAYDT
jgi:ubiquinone/menaquinone biosynthesis C-methylase UbiE